MPQGERGEFQGSRDGAPAGRVLTNKEKTIHARGLVGMLKELHDELDAAVLQAYGLDTGLTPDALLTHLVTLNAQRAAEEKADRIRWLRPEFENRRCRQPHQPIKRYSIRSFFHTHSLGYRPIWHSIHRPRHPPSPPAAFQPGPTRCPSRFAPWPKSSPPQPPPCRCRHWKPAVKAKARGKKACRAFWKRW